MFKRAPVPDDLDFEPILIPHRGRLAWLWPSGRITVDVSGGADDGGADKTFSQADVDRIVQERLARAKSETKVEPPADYAQLQQAATELAALKAKDNTDLEKAQAEIAKLTEANAKLTDGTTKLTETNQNLIKRSAVIAAASKAKAVDPDDVFALLDKTKVTIGDDGQVTGADDAVKALLEAKPHLVGTTTSRPKPDPAQGKTGETKSYGSAGRAEAQKRYGIPAGAQQ